MIGKLTATKKPYSKGSHYERLAREYLQKKGLTFVASNYATPRGEIDLVMRDNETLVFVEVRYRQRRDFGGAIESLDRAKQSRIIYAAQHYMEKYKYSGIVRFDFIAFEGKVEGDPKVQWVPDAFQSTSHF